jgi:ERCC4-related helicase
MTFASDDRVFHPDYGEGTVLVDSGETVIVRFEAGIEECVKGDLVPRRAPLQTPDEWHDPASVVARSLARSIEAINDMWGVFSRSRIALLPHQLWVCHQVLKNWPARWMVADDVGLGKTIEAGLILWPLLSKKTIRRLLILCPASLVDQWQYRLREMFDIRLNTYSPEQDTDRTDYWNTNPMVVASLHTLRDDRNGRHDRLLDSEPWDLVLVDEAHHLNHEEQSGATLAYRLLEKLERHGRVRGMVFFTGTPHKGKDFNFVSLLQLLRKDLFPDAGRPLEHYLPALGEVLIRNNKYSVTDLSGEKLFQPPAVTTETYAYAPEEAAFYEMMTDFVATGKTYASTLGSADARTATLVLITLQKLASSSIAAVRSALQRRLDRLRQTTAKYYDLDHLRELLEREGDGNEDELRALEEVIASHAIGVALMEDEQARIEELLQAASRVRRETKIERIVDIVANRFDSRSVLFFTEYKATQSLLMTRLRSEFGAESITFINGDERAIDVGGETLQIRREVAADAFNSGAARFLVSTEAAGEGIDLQGNCHTLIHVDLPWNPMRLHQRVGRINRYGQDKRVEVVSLRNPDTVEYRIWEKLNSKIDRIQQALGGAMDEPEDLMQLVLGMTSSSMFTELFANAPTGTRGSLSKWFDEQTASFGGRDVIETVRSLIGHSAKFDYQSAAPQIPRLDLPDLEPFFRLMLSLNKRRVSTTSEGLSFITPEEWRGDIGILPRYERMVFDRELRDRDANQRILGVGHKLIEKALEQAKNLEHYNARFPRGSHAGTTVIFRIQNRVTTDEAPVRSTLVGLSRLNEEWEFLDAEGVFRLLSELLKRLDKSAADDEALPAENVAERVKEAQQWLQENARHLELPFKHPHMQLESLLWGE